MYENFRLDRQNFRVIRKLLELENALGGLTCKFRILGFRSEKILESLFMDFLHDLDHSKNNENALNLIF